MSATDPLSRLLIALLELGQSNEVIDLFSLSDEAGVSLFGTLKGLSELAERGLVSAERMRLTMAGLSLACGLRAEQGGAVGSRERAGWPPEGDEPRAESGSHAGADGRVAARGRSAA